VHDDPLVRNIGRLSIVICLLAAAAAAAVAGGRVAAGVLGGGLLIGISFYTIGGGVAAIVAAASGGTPSRKTLGRTVLKLALRYALLGFLAYVMIARLRLHPIGLLVGASSVPAAAFVEAVRLLVKRT
jgi:hypothetical protein